MPIFQRRHYDWLAGWAGDNIGYQHARSLATALAADNPDFHKNRFLVAYVNRRLSHVAEVEAAKRARQGTPMPVPIKANLDEIINSENQS